MVGLFFEILFRRTLFSEFITTMRELFDEDPALAKSLRDEVRRKRVKYTLQAHLGPERGEAIYNAMVRPYLTGRSTFRPEMQEEISILDLDEDIALVEGSSPFILGRKDYRRVVARTAFVRLFEKKRCHYAGCVFTDDFAELYAWFKRGDCIIREVLCLSPTDAARLATLVDGPDAEAAAIIGKLFGVTVRINDQLAPAEYAFTSATKRSMGFRLKLPRGIKAEPSRFEIRVETVMSRSVRKYPLILAEPCLNPSIAFCYSKSMTNIVPAPFFAGEAPFEPRISHHCCPAITRTESTGYRYRVNRSGSRNARRPVKWAFFRKGLR